jgi:hypothetical protein
MAAAAAKVEKKYLYNTLRDNFPEKWQFLTHKKDTV